MVIMKNYKLLALCLLTLAFFGCDEKEDKFNLDGECQIISLTLDETYKAVIDGTNKTAVVTLPATYDVQDMTITEMTLSDGATATLSKGQHINLTVPQRIKVTNGNVFSEYTLSAKHDEARILSFILNDKYRGIIDESAHTIAVFVPVGTNLTALIPTIRVSEGATIEPASGVSCDFTNPVEFTVTYNTASSTYTVTVSEMAAPHCVYVGLAATMEQLNIEEQTACLWMLANIEKSAYVSFTDIANGTVDLSECKVIWWHLHKDGGIDGKGNFEANAAEALTENAINALKTYYTNGGHFFLTRYATYLPAYLGEKDCVPNNCWGQNEADAETTSGTWDFSIAGHTDHALWQNLLTNSENLNSVYVCNAGYRITNSTAQYHIGSDWGGYPTREDFRTKTGAIDIAGGDDAVVAWEYEKTASHGCIICIGSGCYDWYSVGGETGTEHYHKNIATITQNAINYLKNK